MDNKQNSSSVVEVREIDKLKGKGLFATKCIQKDEVIFEEAHLFYNLEILLSL